MKHTLTLFGPGGEVLTVITRNSPPAIQMVKATDPATGQTAGPVPRQVTKTFGDHLEWDEYLISDGDSGKELGRFSPQLVYGWIRNTAKDDDGRFFEPV